MVLLPCAAFAGVDEITVSIGARDTFRTGNGPADGGSAGVRLASKAWEVGIAQYTRLAGDDPTPLTLILLERAQYAEAGTDFRQPEDAATAATTLWVSWGPVGDTGFWGGPRLIVGLEGRVVARSLYAYDPASPVHVDPVGVTRLFGIGPIGGVAFDARFASPLGLRLSLVDRTWFGPDIAAGTPDRVGSSNEWFHDPTLSLDLSWSL